MTAHRQGADCEAQWVITKQESPETEGNFPAVNPDS